MKKLLSFLLEQKTKKIRMEWYPVVSVFIVVSCFQRFLMTSLSILEEMIYLCTYL